MNDCPMNDCPITDCSMTDCQMADCHIHLEKGDYTVQWVGQFAQTAKSRGIDEICLLEHCYRFEEFAPMYDGVRQYSPYFADWYKRRVGVKKLADYLRPIENIRKHDFGVKIRFGLEVCYFEGQERLVKNVTNGSGLDFLVGSVHQVDNFPYDFEPSHWDGLDVDRIFRRYFEISAALAGSGLFDGIAHPDCIKLYGNAPSFERAPHYEKLADAVAAAGIYAEENSGASRRAGCEFGLAPDLLAALLRRGVIIKTASDAHCPEDVGKGVAEGREIIRKAQADIRR